MNMDDCSILEILSVYTPPYVLNFVEFINCPICEMEIDVYNKMVDENSYAYCEDCKHKIQFKLVKI
jgi:hypothetical protein